MLERLETTDFHAGTGVDTTLGKEIFDSFPVCTILAGQEQTLVLQIGWCYVILRSQRMRGRDEQRDWFKKERLKG